MNTQLRLLAVCGMAASVSAQPYLINGSGATLQEAFFNAPASTNDFIDVDGDGLIAIDGDQLAPFDASEPWNASQYWQVTYRVVGSGNGFAEMRDWGIAFATAPDGDVANGTLNCEFSDSSLWNRGEFCAAGLPSTNYNAMNPGGTPVRSLDDGSYLVTTSTGAGTGISVDWSALDVPVSWFTINDAGSPLYNRVPGAPGYGDNPRVAVNKDGSFTTQGNKLKSLVGLNGTLNVNVNNPDANTVYDTPISLTPVAAISNVGNGLEQIEMSDLRQLMATGRRANGENLVAVTRDSGSGTRNAFANGICLDPSWCVGENIGDRTVSSSNDLLGPNHQPSNKGGSSRVEATVINHRLAIGHTGAERGESSGWLLGNRAEVLAVRADLKGGTVFARPNLDNVLDGGPDGYNITGPATIAMIGNPRSDSAAVGGWGWAASETGPFPGPVQPPRNENASAYLNNITRSTSAFVALPGSDETLFTPGEFLATQFLLVPAASFVPETNPDAGDDCIELVPNPDFNSSLQDFIRDESGNVLGLSDFDTYDSSHAGLVPVRTDGVGGYTDSAPDGFYMDQAGATYAYGSALNMRNRIAGDFDGNGVRNNADSDDMVAAWQDRNGGPAFQAGTDVIIEVIGDFTGDGNFMKDDVRYWADGLHMGGPGVDVLDRAAGFEAVDDAFGGNFFGTTLANGTYDNGDSVADVSNPDHVNARGWNPIGADTVVDNHDIDWVCRNFGVWSDLGDAVNMDLSCDMNADLVVDMADVDAVLAILETTYGDVNLDGMVDAADESIVMANQGMTNAGWADGDTDCDGDVDEDDLSVFCQADINGDTVLDIFDVLDFLGLFDGGDAAADWNGDTVLDIFDVLEYLGDFDAGC